MKTTSFEISRELSPENITELQSKIGGQPSTWTVDEIGDGNVNLIFRIQGPNGQALVKQAVPYLRCVGEAWPLSLKRNYFEYRALQEHSAVAAEYLPKVFAFNEKSALMVMEFLGNHIILRKGVMSGKKYPHFSEHITDYIAKTLFYTSDLYLNAGQKKEKMKLFCDNVDLCKITEDLIFTDPYRKADQNRWTTPQLDSIVREFSEDAPLKTAVAKMKAKFLTSAQALIHGDLHTGSIMVNENETKVIDPEFAFYGPMGFDVGLLLANFLMGYFSQAGRGAHENERVEYEKWLLQQVQEIWSKFSVKFSRLWDQDLKGDFLTPGFVGCDSGLEIIRQVRAEYMENLFQDSIQFAGTEMIRRTLGLAHVADLDSIADPDQRALCETRVLRMARNLLINKNYKTIDDVIVAAQKLRATQSVS